MGRTGIGVIWLCVCCVIQTSLGQLVNVARGKTYNQSSYYKSNRPSSNAANGNTGGTLGWINCIHTSNTDYEPWWQVDLGRNYPVYNVTVWARTNFTSRLYPLNITVDGQQCVRAMSVSRQQSLSCTSPITGRVVRLTRYYRNSGNDISLNLCEVKIWSTYQAGDYSNGTACVPCSSTCKNSLCNSNTGRCDMCNSGYYVSGASCVGCNSNCVNRQCDSNNGYCTQGCNAGWYGDRCNSRCSVRTPRCTQCARNDGQCTACSGHFKSPQCTDCVDGFYKTGTSCTNCTWKCDKDAPCNKTTGHCAECPPGKKGDRCDRVCTDNTYGTNCSQGCGQCKDGQACNPQTGECTAGCGPGFKSSDVLCKTKCDNGMRGENCSIRCGQCQYVTSCHHVTGECGESGCVPGYSGALCLQLEDNDSLVGPIVGAIVGSVLGAGLLIAISVCAAIRWRRKSNRSAGKATTVEMASAPANNLSDSAITGPHPPPPSSSTPGVEGSVYEIVDNDNDKNKGLTRQPAQPSSSSIPGVEGSVYEITDNDNDTNSLPTAPPPSSSTVGDEGRHYENVILQVNTYDKLCPYANDDRDRELYTELDDGSTKT